MYILEAVGVLLTLCGLKKIRNSNSTVLFHVKDVGVKQVESRLTLSRFSDKHLHLVGKTNRPQSCGESACVVFQGCLVTLSQKQEIYFCFLTPLAETQALFLKMQNRFEVSFCLQPLNCQETGCLCPEEINSILNTALCPLF